MNDDEMKLKHYSENYSQHVQGPELLDQFRFR